MGGHVCTTGGPSKGQCYYGMAPQTTILVVRVFDMQRRTCPAYIIRALQYLLAQPVLVDIVNLSFGATDFTHPTVYQLVRQLVALSVVVVTAAGNEGTVLGSALSPGSLAEVLTVGATHVSFVEGERGPVPRRIASVATFSSRGPTTDELPFGAGRLKPEVLAAGVRVAALQSVRYDKRSVSRNTGVRGDHETVTSLNIMSPSGTSVAAPIVTGVLAILLQRIRQLRGGASKLSVGLAKAALMSTARRLELNDGVREQLSSFHRPHHRAKSSAHNHTFAGDPLLRTYLHYTTILLESMWSQGAGEIDVDAALRYVDDYCSRNGSALLVAVPPALHNVVAVEEKERVGPPPGACRYYWPWCEQPLYAGAAPRIFNITVHGIDAAYASAAVQETDVVFQRMVGIEREAQGSLDSSRTIYTTHPLELNSVPLHIVVAASPRLEAFTGSLSVLASVNTSAREYGRRWGSWTQLNIVGYIHVCYVGTEGMKACGNVPFDFSVIPPPPRHRRIVLEPSWQWLNPLQWPEKDPQDAFFLPGDDPHEGAPALHMFPSYPYGVSSDGAMGHGITREYGERYGDHPHTNLALLYLYLRRELHAFVECFPMAAMAGPQDGHLLQNYWKRVRTVVVIDPELPLLRHHRLAMIRSVQESGVGVLVFADWFDPRLAQHLRWQADRHTPSPRGPIDNLGFAESGGATEAISLPAIAPHSGRGLPGSCHVPSVNALLREMLHPLNRSMVPLPKQLSKREHGAHLQFASNRTLDASLLVGDPSTGRYRSLGTITAGAVLELHGNPLPFCEADDDHYTLQLCNTKTPWKEGQNFLGKERRSPKTPTEDTWTGFQEGWEAPYGILGLVDFNRTTSGRLVVFGDSNCLSAADPRVIFLFLNLVDAMSRAQHQLLSAEALHKLLAYVRVVEGTQQATVCLELVKVLLHAMTAQSVDVISDVFDCRGTNDRQQGTSEELPFDMKHVTFNSSRKEEEEEFVQLHVDLLAATPSRVVVLEEVRALFAKVKYSFDEDDRATLEANAPQAADAFEDVVATTYSDVIEHMTLWPSIQPRIYEVDSLSLLMVGGAAAIVLFTIWKVLQPFWEPQHRKDE